MGEITEFYGESGSGKTQICMQLSINVQIPAPLMGVDKTCLYIDTETAVHPMRLMNMATAMEAHLERLLDSPFVSCDKETLQRYKTQFSRRSLIKNVRIVQCGTLSQLFSTISKLPVFLENNESVKLVIIDSISNLFRFSSKLSLDTLSFLQINIHNDVDVFHEVVLRARILTALGTWLHRIANHFNVAIVTTSQCYGTMNADVPSTVLGEAWNAIPNQRFYLSRFLPRPTPSFPAPRTIFSAHKTHTLFLDKSVAYFETFPEGIRKIGFSSRMGSNKEEQDNRKQSPPRLPSSPSTKRANV